MSRTFKTSARLSLGTLICGFAEPTSSGVDSAEWIIRCPDSSRASAEQASATFPLILMPKCTKRPVPSECKANAIVQEINKSVNHPARCNPSDSVRAPINYYNAVWCHTTPILFLVDLYNPVTRRRDPARRELSEPWAGQPLRRRNHAHSRRDNRAPNRGNQVGSWEKNRRESVNGRGNRVKGIQGVLETRNPR